MDGTEQFFECQDIGDVTVIRFRDRNVLDHRNAQFIHDQLLRLVEECGRTKLLINFDNVGPLNSSFVGMLIMLFRRIERLGGKLLLHNPDRPDDGPLGVLARLIPPMPSDSHSASLRPPRHDPD